MLIYKIDYTGLDEDLDYNEIRRSITCGTKFKHISTMSHKEDASIFMDIIKAAHEIYAAAKRNYVYDDIFIAVSYDYELINKSEITRFFDEHRDWNIQFGFFPELRQSKANGRWQRVPKWISKLSEIAGISYENKEMFDRFGTELLQADYSMVVKNYYEVNDKCYDHSGVLEIEINGQELFIKAKVSRSHFDWYFSANTGNSSVYEWSSKIDYSANDGICHCLSLTFDFPAENITVENKALRKIESCKSYY